MFFNCIDHRNSQKIVTALTALLGNKKFVMVHCISHHDRSEPSLDLKQDLELSRAIEIQNAEKEHPIIVVHASDGAHYFSTAVESIQIEDGKRLHFIKLAAMEQGQKPFLPFKTGRSIGSRRFAEKEGSTFIVDPSFVQEGKSFPKSTFPKKSPPPHQTNTNSQPL